MQLYNSFIHLVFIGLVALFPVVNPIGSAFILNPYLSDLDKADKRRAVKKITLYSFFICTFSLFAGHWILELFGISIPVIQLAGGVMICKMGWEFLTSDKKEERPIKTTEEVIGGYKNIEDKLFYPITFPTTTGAGTISVLFTLGAHSERVDVKSYFINAGAIMLSITIICVLIYFFYFNTKTIINYLGSSGEKIVNRIAAFLIFCVGLQIAITGIKSLLND